MGLSSAAAGSESTACCFAEPAAGLVVGEDGAFWVAGAGRGTRVSAAEVAAAAPGTVRPGHALD
ncbi:hypothetical protein, partial [Streptomyces harbinensis]|uniref:hypothetical protein n=1 Tax=Streptomyces harbinensis TaxID=1176198 RepID=UPI0034DF78B4